MGNSTDYNTVQKEREIDEQNTYSGDNTQWLMCFLLPPCFPQHQAMLHPLEARVSYFCPSGMMYLHRRTTWTCPYDSGLPLSQLQKKCSSVLNETRTSPMSKKVHNYLNSHASLVYKYRYVFTHICT